MAQVQWAGNTGLPSNTKVRVHSPRTFLDGAIGEIVGKFLGIAGDGEDGRCGIHLEGSYFGHITNIVKGERIDVLALPEVYMIGHNTPEMTDFQFDESGIIAYTTLQEAVDRAIELDTDTETNSGYVIARLMSGRMTDDYSFESLAIVAFGGRVFWQMPAWAYIEPNESEDRVTMRLRGGCIHVRERGVTLDPANGFAFGQGACGMWHNTYHGLDLVNIKDHQIPETDLYQMEAESDE